MRLQDLAGRRVLVLGLGLHGGGAAVARWLARHGARVTVSDLKPKSSFAATLLKLRGLPIRYVWGKHPASLLRQCDLIIQNPAVPKELPFLKLARQRGIPIENEATLFLKLCPASLVIGVTGSKGKSTTSTLLGAMLRRLHRRTVVAGNIRDTVMFQVLDKLTPGTPVVLELSSWHLEGVAAHRLRLPIALVTNVFPEHLNRYPSLAAYAKAKAGIFRAQKPQDAIVLNYDNKITQHFGSQAPGRVYWFSVSRLVPRGVYVSSQVVYWRDGSSRRRLFAVRDIKLSGEHNLQAALAAAAVACLAGVPAADIATAVKSFKGLHDRLEPVRTWRGLTFYNDTTATAPAAVQAALRAVDKGSIVLIAGGADKNLDYHELARDIRRRVQALILLPGTATVKLQSDLKDFGPVFLAANMPAAVKLAARLANPGGVVLLSPGAASFGLFQHEFDRGAQFVQAVCRLK